MKRVLKSSTSASASTWDAKAHIQGKLPRNNRRWHRRKQDLRKSPPCKLTDLQKGLFVSLLRQDQCVVEVKKHCFYCHTWRRIGELSHSHTLLRCLFQWLVVAEAHSTGANGPAEREEKFVEMDFQKIEAQEICSMTAWPSWRHQALYTQ